MIDLNNEHNSIRQNGHPGEAANAGIVQWLQTYLANPAPTRLTGLPYEGVKSTRKVVLDSDSSCHTFSSTP